MKITNKTGIPSTIVNFMSRDPYDKGPADFSVTQLIDSPKISQLQEENEIEIDAADRIWTLMGSAVHAICEGGAQPGHIIEERFFVDCGGAVVSGAVDVQEPNEDGTYTIFDYKLVRAWSVMTDKPAWEQQLNLYRYMAHKAHGRNVTRIAIVAIIRDFSAKKAKFEPGYPSHPIVVIDMPLWGLDEAQGFLLKRVKLHQASRSLPKPFPCIDRERWTRQVWAVMEGKKKRAVRLFYSREDAEEFLNAFPSKDYRIEERSKNYVRCEGNYCQVREWCDQWP